MKLQTTQPAATYAESRSGSRSASSAARNVPDWPFWKSIPRFDREYNTADLATALTTLACARSAETGLENYFPAACGVGLTRSGRESLYVILNALGLRSGSRIGVPLYCCEAVFAAIAAAGHVPIFLDVDLNSYGLAEESVWRHRNELDALVVVHTFGYPADLTHIQECLKEREIPVIEDCAHSLFSEYMGAPTGSWTHASFLTFGVHKPAAAGGGGMIAINNPALAAKVSWEMNGLLESSRAQEVRHSLVGWARGLFYIRGAYGVLLASVLAGKRDAETDEAQIRVPVGKTVRLSPQKIRLVDRALVGARVRRFRTSLPALAHNASRIRAAVSDTVMQTPAEPTNGRWNHFMVPVRYKSEAHRDAGRRLLLRKGIDTAPLYRNCIRNARKYGYGRACPNSELAAQTVCTVPNHAWLSEDEIQHICDALTLSAREK